MENYEVLETLGSGSFGKVCKVVRKSDNKVLVWKELNYANMNEKEKQQLVAEVNILRELKHNNVVRYHDRIIDKQNQRIWIVMEYCEGGDLGQMIKRTRSERGYIPEDLIWKYFKDIVMALHEIHRRKEGKILHRDLKPANIFLDAQNNAKVGDFGLSKILTDDNGFAYTTVGTPYYMSPEQLKENRYNEKSDVWACGCLLYELCALKRPFEAANHLSLALKIKSGKFDRIPLKYSEELQRVIAWILTVDVNQRPAVEDLTSIPQISMFLRKKRCEEIDSAIKKKELEYEKKMQELQDLEIALKNRESELQYKETKMRDQERDGLFIRDRERERGKEKEREFQTPIIQSFDEKIEMIPERVMERPKSSAQIRDYLSNEDRIKPHLKTLESDYKEYHKDKDIPRPRTHSSNQKLQSYLSMDLGSERTLGSDRNFSIDRTLNSTIEAYGSNKNVSRVSLRTEEGLGETHLNMEISNILKNMDRIVAQTKGYAREASPKFDKFDKYEKVPSTMLARKNSNRFLNV